MARSKIINAKAKEVLEYIRRDIKNLGYPPSVREICRGVGLKSTSSVHTYLNQLAEVGYITKTGLKTRALRILDEDNGLAKEDDQNMVSLPVIGNVAAGAPILAEENIEDYFKINANYLKRSANKNDTYMLKVKGESMINVGIFNGDYIIVEKKVDASNGEIIVALIGDEATVKTFYKEKDHIRLQPENDTMDPIIVKDVKILGKVIGLFRKY